MGRPRKPDSERRSKLFYLRLRPREMEELSRAARDLHLPVAEILRHGAALYLSTASSASLPKTSPERD